MNSRRECYIFVIKVIKSGNLTASPKFGLYLLLLITLINYLKC